jgi:transcriptional regulator with XRE-family HTH domain
MNQQIGKTIATMRAYKALTQSQLAEKVGISQNHLSNIETGKRKLDVETLIAILKALDMKGKTFFKFLENRV